MARIVGRYAIFDELAHGGMASVHIGRLRGAAGFVRTVAVKRLHAQYARDPAFVAMLVDEARLAARIKHPNVVPVLDVVSGDGELFLVMEYVVGETVSRLIVRSAEQGSRVPVPIAAAIMVGALTGLHAAHEAVSEYGEPLGIVHRDVSPQNIIVGVDGVARVFDFGVAKAAQRSQTTHDGALKGKIGYMSPEQLHGERIDRRSDIYAAGVVLWEVLVGQRLFLSAEGQPGLLLSLTQTVEAPSRKVPELPRALDQVVLRALERDPADRFANALDMARAIEASVVPASQAQVGAWVRELAADALATKARTVARIESIGELSPLDSTGELPMTREDPTQVDANPEQLAQLRMVGSEADTPAAPRTRAAWAIAAGLAVSAAVSGAWLVARHADTDAPAASTATFPAMPAPSSMPSAAREAPSSDPPGSVAAPASSAPAKPASIPRKPPPRVVPPEDCDPPFTLDDQGHKRYKRHCFP